MRALRFLNVAILSVLVGSAALVYAQDDKQSDDKPARQEEPRPEPKQAEPKQDEAKPPQQDEAKPSKQEKEMEKQDEKRAQQQSRDQAMPDKDKQEHPDMKGGNARPAGKSGRIPDDKFRAHFGQGHHFSARGVIVAGQPQFRYSGYTFEFVDAWPAGWAYTDDCYIDFIDGEYFLFDLLHPGVRIALIVVL
jgi:hypothetical protein